MMDIKVSLRDNDYVIRAEKNLLTDRENDTLLKFIRYMDEEFVAGETAYLEIEGLKSNPITLEISHSFSPEKVP